MAQYSLGPVSSAVVDVSLAQYFSWAGASFPFNSASPDITISAPTTWIDSVGYKKVGKLTINAGQTLNIQYSPFFIFANEINFGDTTSTINASGLDGSATPTVFPSNMTAGGYKLSTGKAQGGGGGGMLFILCNKITGANGVIKANGGNGYANTSYPTTAVSSGGQGSLSALRLNTGATEQNHFSLGMSNFYAVKTTDTMINSIIQLLGNGGSDGASNSLGGGSGAGTPGPGGGSGIGGGGGGSGNGSQSAVTPNPLDLLTLASLKCLGGGGGGAYLGTTFNRGAGGGGGSVVAWTHVATATPTVQANGGLGAGDVAMNGAAGVAYLITL